jgi:hypothetical protein
VRAARASLTSNFEKSLKKNETALDFCPSVRSKGLSGLSSPVPPIVEHHFPVQCAGGGAASAFAHNRRAGVAACGEAARGEVRARACVDSGAGARVVVDNDGVAGVVAVAGDHAVVDIDRVHRGLNAIIRDHARPAGQRVILES